MQNDFCGLKCISVSFFHSFILNFSFFLFFIVCFCLFVYSWLTEGIFGKRNHLSLFWNHFLMPQLHPSWQSSSSISSSPLFPFPFLLLRCLIIRADSRTMLLSDLGFNNYIIKRFCHPLLTILGRRDPPLCVPPQELFLNNEGSLFWPSWGLGSGGCHKYLAC